MFVSFSPKGLRDSGVHRNGTFLNGLACCKGTVEHLPQGMVGCLPYRLDQLLSTHPATHPTLGSLCFLISLTVSYARYGQRGPRSSCTALAPATTSASPAQPAVPVSSPLLSPRSLPPSSCSPLTRPAPPLTCPLTHEVSPATHHSRALLLGSHRLQGAVSLPSNPPKLSSFLPQPLPLSGSWQVLWLLIWSSPILSPTGQPVSCLKFICIVL